MGGNAPARGVGYAGVAQDRTRDATSGGVVARRRASREASQREVEPRARDGLRAINLVARKGAPPPLRRVACAASMRPPTPEGERRAGLRRTRRRVACAASMRPPTPEGEERVFAERGDAWPARRHGRPRTPESERRAGLHQTRRRVACAASMRPAPPRARSTTLVELRLEGPGMRVGPRPRRARPVLRCVLLSGLRDEFSAHVAGAPRSSCERHPCPPAPTRPRRERRPRETGAAPEQIHGGSTRRRR